METKDLRLYSAYANLSPGMVVRLLKLRKAPGL